jgi:hypothetical protein
LDIKENKVGTTSISKYDYAVNSVNQRDSVAKSGTAFGGSSYTLWKYDALGQVTQADDSTATANACKTVQS